MKLNFRIILINFAIVIIILSGAALAFYSIMFNIITAQQKRHLQNSANNLLLALDDAFTRQDNSFNAFLQVLNKNGKKNEKPVLPHGLDFAAKVENDSTFDASQFFISENIYQDKPDFSVSGFIRNNPFVIIREYVTAGNEKYFYGVAVNKDYINNLSVRIGSELSVYLPDKQVEMSNENINQKYLYIINSAHDQLIKRSNFEIYTYQSGANFLISTIYRVGHSVVNAGDLTLIIYSVLNEAEGLRQSVGNALIILGVVGVLLSFILTYIFTVNIRRQLNELNAATGIVKAGNFKERLQLESKDEIGELADAFNKMLDALDRQEQIKNDYTDFITLINRNPNQEEITDTALTKIMNAGKFSYSVIYTETEEDVQSVLLKGDTACVILSENKKELIKEVFASGTEFRARLNVNGTLEDGIQDGGACCAFLLPVIYGYKIIAVIELGSREDITPGLKEHIIKIIAQLAIGLNNAQTLQILENLVKELKQLNEESKQQNVKISGQNEKLLELHAQLTQKAIELTVQKQRAEELTELKSKFLATISHELRTPMSTILGLTELIIKSGSLDTKTKERQEVVLRSGKRLLSLINGLLDLSKIEAGKMDVFKETFPLKDVIDELENTFSIIASGKGLSFSVTTEFEEEIFLNTDRHKLLQIIINLLGNSVKFTETGSVELMIGLFNESGIRFKVTDTGIGIGPEEQKIIFEEFRQVDSSSSRKYGGSGLGLSISQKFAALIGGKLNLQSEPGKGSVFTLEIPGIVVTSEITPDITDTEEESSLKNLTARILNDEFKNTETPVSINDLKISGREREVLIVDDDPDTLFTLNEMIRNFGYKTMLAKNGFECLEILEKKIPAVILLDIMMPRMDGFQTIKAIREESKYKELPIFAVTARATVEEKESILAAGFDEFISKPVDPVLLAQKIASVY